MPTKSIYTGKSYRRNVNDMDRKMGASMCAVLVLSLLGLLMNPMTANATGKIAVIDMQKVMRESHAGKAAMEKLNKKFEKLREELKKKQEELKAFKDDLEKKAPLLSDEARAEKERQYKKMLREFKDQSDDAQFEMRQAESRTMEPILKELEKIVTKIGKERGYSLILENKMPGIYYVAPDADITDEVIKAYDELKAKEQKGKGAK